MPLLVIGLFEGQFVFRSDDRTISLLDLASRSIQYTQLAYRQWSGVSGDVIGIFPGLSLDSIYRVPSRS